MAKAVKTTPGPSTTPPSRDVTSIDAATVSPAPADAAETATARRLFIVDSVLLHDGEEYAPGELVALTEPELDPLRRAGVVDPATGWLDGAAPPEV